MNLWDIVDSVLETEEAERESKVKDSWWPSEALGCRRRSWYAFRGGDGRLPMDLTGLYRTKTGNLLHDWVFEQVAKSGLFDNLEQEVEMKQEVKGLRYPVSGKMDLRGVLKSNGKRAAADLKTTFGEGIRKIKQKREISTHYLGQMICYLKWGEIDELILGFLGRDDQYRTQMVLTLEDDVLHIDGTKTRLSVHSVVSRWQDVERHLESGQIPDRDFMAAIRDGEIVYSFQRNNVTYKSDWRCRYCPYRLQCWAPELEKYAKGVNTDMWDGV